MNHVFHIVVNTLCRLDFGLCFHTLATFIHTDRHLSQVHLLIKRKLLVLLVLMKCCSSPAQGCLWLTSLFSLSINLSETFSDLLKQFECILPTKDVEVDVLILTDGSHRGLNVQIRVLRLPKKHTVGCLCQPYLWLLSLLFALFHF